MPATLEIRITTIAETQRMMIIFFCGMKKKKKEGGVGAKYQTLDGHFNL